MNLKFILSKIALLILGSICSNAYANTTFQGDVNQASSSDPAPVYTGDIIVGNNQVGGSAQTPSGTLMVDAGSQVIGNQSLIIGNLANSSGRATITGVGTTLNLMRFLNVGNGAGSYGELNILDGAVVGSASFASPAGRVGAGAGSIGVVNVSGTGSTWNSQGTTSIGDNGTGYLNISSGGTVNALSLRVGNSAGSDGTVSVDGGALNVIGSRSIGSGIIGNAGTGRIYITNGGTVSDSFTLIGNAAGGDGTVSVSGSGSVFNSNLNTIVGNGGKGLIEVTDGGTFNASSSSNPPGSALVLGAVAVASGIPNGGSVRIQGAGSTVNAMGGNTVIGENDTGTILLEDGGRLNTDNIIIASQADSSGQLFIGFNGSAAGSINDDANITFGDGQGFLSFNHNEQINFNNLIQGNGTVIVDSGTTTLTAENTWGGRTLVNGGTLKAGGENTLSPNSSYEVAADGVIDLDGHNQSLGNVSNAGTINLSGQEAGTVMTINGNYAGNNGLLVFGTALGDDNSTTDRMNVTGDTSGTSRVAVNNLGGTGAQTLNGIELINVGGTSAGEFTQEGRIVAGAWEYHLARGEGGNSGNWYLSTKAEDNGGGDNGGGDNGGGDNGGGDNGGGDNGGGDNGGGDNGGGDNGGGDNGGGDNGPDIEVLRPEGGAYTANLYAADNMFSAPLSDRLGETEYTDNISGEQKLTSLWMKNTGGHTRFNDNSGQLRTRSNRYSLLLGGDLATGSSQEGSAWRTGALVGYGNNQSNTLSKESGYNAKGQVNGYTTGIYATWYADGNSEQGAYIDGLVQYSWFTNSVRGEELQEEKYNSKGLQTTLETGYVFAMGGVNGDNDLNWYLQPKASVAWSGIKADQHKENNGTIVQGNGNDNVSSKLGLKVFLKGHSTLDDGKNRNFKPFIETNWIHNTQTRGVSMDGVEISQAGSHNIGEARIGVEGRLTPQFNLTGYAGQQIGDSGYSDTSAVIGIKYSF
ncbi:Autotransporter outer membrane beta-barrel domain-containing protein [Rahnella bruchi]|uniref:autotransporter outer membrane beta-barrel domain-containing protein n=3 Tax=Rahnella bruchi TaxID=1510573 RepID=UPI0039EF9FDC